MTKRKFLLVLVMLLALLLRYFKLADYPGTLYGDEQAFAWNAYNILKTGSDEYGTRLPLEFRSFDDYKAPLPVYLLVPLFKFLGMNAFSIRLPVVIFSVSTVMMTYILLKHFLNRKQALIGTFLLAISAWHIHLSRGYFEATISLFFLTAGIYFFIRAKPSVSSLLAAVLLAMSVYSYFTSRILLPILLPILTIYLYKFKLKTIRQSLFTICLLSVLAIPLIISIVSGMGLSRFQKLSESLDSQIVQTVIRERSASYLAEPLKVLFHNKYQARLKITVFNYLEHLSANFLFISGDSSLRYFLGDRGMLYLAEYPFILAGLYLVFRYNRSAFWFMMIWLLASPVPASLVGKPFAVRSLAMLPVPYAFASAGIYALFVRLPKINWQSVSAVFVSIVFMLSLFFYLTRYYLEYPLYAATWWGWENKAALDYAKMREDDYNMIFISDFYSGITLADAVYNSLDPLSYRQAKEAPVVLADNRHLVKIGKYYFGSLDLNESRLKEKILPSDSLYIGRPEEPGGEDEIRAPDDGRLLFVVHDTHKKACYIDNSFPCHL